MNVLNDHKNGMVTKTVEWESGPYTKRRKTVLGNNQVVTKDLPFMSSKQIDFYKNKRENGLTIKSIHILTSNDTESRTNFCKVIENRWKQRQLCNGELSYKNLVDWKDGTTKILEKGTNHKFTK